MVLMMSLMPRPVVGALALVFAALASASAVAAEAPQPVRLPAALIVDMAQILQEAKAGKDVHGVYHLTMAQLSRRLAFTRLRYGADGFGQSLYLFDPEGNMVELKGPPEAAHATSL